MLDYFLRRIRYATANSPKIAITASNPGVDVGDGVTIDAGGDGAGVGVDGGATVNLSVSSCMYVLSTPSIV